MSDREFFRWFAVMTVVIITVALIGVGFMRSITCDAKAGRMGIAYDWKFIGGCMIEETPGKWIPLENYRVMD